MWLVNFILCFNRKLGSSAVSLDFLHFRFFLIKTLGVISPSRRQQRFRAFCSMLISPLATNLCMCVRTYRVEWTLSYRTHLGDCCYIMYVYICVCALFAQLLPSVAPKCIHTCIMYMYMSNEIENHSSWKVRRNRSLFKLYDLETESTTRKEIPNMKWSQDVPGKGQRVRLLQKIRIKL